ncbi:MAG: hypothetical protein GY703_10245 [Gammaproteobacteria bacterium]|nr:hypothetical protein [Gammaproteobacteria bacterium]
MPAAGRPVIESSVLNPCPAGAIRDHLYRQGSRSGKPGKLGKLTLADYIPNQDEAENFISALKQTFARRRSR